jgi:hypothetical protein
MEKGIDWKEKHDILLSKFNEFQIDLEDNKTFQKSTIDTLTEKAKSYKKKLKQTSLLVKELQEQLETRIQHEKLLENQIIEYQERQDRVDTIKKHVQKAQLQLQTFQSQESILQELNRKYQEILLENKKLQETLQTHQLLLKFQSHIIPEHENLKTINIKLELENQELKKELAKVSGKLKDTRMLFQLEFHRGMERSRKANMNK